MPKIPTNSFKAALKAGQQQIGLWNTIGGNTVPELLAGAGFDWICIDTEHSPVEVTGVLSALQQCAAYDVRPVVRPAFNDQVLIKRVMDYGAQTLLIPYVQSPEEAAAAVRATRYPPQGLRGVSGMTRASGYGTYENYTAMANAEICVLVQVETGEALAQLEAIAQVEGVDGVFIGPADLAASLGHPGNPGHPEVKAAIEDAIKRLAAIGVPSGILTLDKAFVRDCMDWGTRFTAVGIDMSVLATGVRALAKEFKG